MNLQNRLSQYSILVALFLLLLGTNSPSGAQERFTLLCNPPLFGGSSIVDITRSSDLCQQIAGRFEERFGREFNVRIDLVVALDRDGFARIISDRTIDLWLGGNRRFHQLAQEKGITRVTKQVNVRWHDRPLSASIPAECRNCKLSFIFLEWLETTEDIHP